MNFIISDVVFCLLKVKSNNSEVIIIILVVVVICSGLKWFDSFLFSRLFSIMLKFINIMMIVINFLEKLEILIINGFIKLNYVKMLVLLNMVVVKISYGFGFFRKWNCLVSFIFDVLWRFGIYISIERIISVLNRVIRKKV